MKWSTTVITRRSKMRDYLENSELKNNMGIIRNYPAAPRPIAPPIERSLDLPTPRQENLGENQTNPDVITHLTGQCIIYQEVYS